MSAKRCVEGGGGGGSGVAALAGDAESSIEVNGKVARERMGSTFEDEDDDDAACC